LKGKYFLSLKKILGTAFFLKNKKIKLGGGENEVFLPASAERTCHYRLANSLRTA
jgi:hypothetical protein